MDYTVVRTKVKTAIRRSKVKEQDKIAEHRIIYRYLGVMLKAKKICKEGNLKLVSSKGKDENNCRCS